MLCAFFIIKLLSILIDFNVGCSYNNTVSKIIWRNDMKKEMKLITPEEALEKFF